MKRLDRLGTCRIPGSGQKTMDKITSPSSQSRGLGSRKWHECRKGRRSAEVGAGERGSRQRQLQTSALTDSTSMPKPSGRCSLHGNRISFSTSILGGPLESRARAHAGHSATQPCMRRAAGRFGASKHAFCPVLGEVKAWCPLCRVSELSASPAQLHWHLVLDAANADLHCSRKIILAEHLKELNTKHSRLICLGLWYKQVSARSLPYLPGMSQVESLSRCSIPQICFRTNPKHRKVLSEWIPHGRANAATACSACFSVGRTG